MAIETQTELKEQLLDAAENKATDKIGEYLGLKKLDPIAAQSLHSLVQMVMPHVRRFGEEYSGKLIDATLDATGKSHLKDSFRKVGTKVIGYGLPALPNIASFWNTFKETNSELTELRDYIAPVLKAKNKLLPGALSFLTTGMKDNEVIAVARGRMLGRMQTGLSQDVVGLIDLVPQVYLKVREDELTELAKPLTDEVERQMKQRRGKQGGAYAEQKLREQIEDQILKNPPKKLSEAVGQYADRRDKFGEHKDIIEKAAPLVGSLATGAAQRALGKRNSENETIALDLIVQLADEITKNPGAQQYSLNGNYYSLPDAIEGIFKLHRKNILPKSSPLPPTRLTEVAEQIASAISQEKLNPLALINLVGERKVVVDKSGKIGTEEQVQKAIDEQLAVLSKEKPIDAKTYLNDTALRTEQIKQIFDASKDNKDELAFLASVFPSRVVMEATGMKRGELRSLMRRAHHQYYSAIESTVLSLAEMPDDELKKYDLAEKDIGALRSVVAKTEEYGRDAIDQAVGTESTPGVERIVAKAAANGFKSWQDYISAKRGGSHRPIGEEELSAAERYRASHDIDGPARN